MDIDIDFQSDFDPTTIIDKTVRASIFKNSETGITPHPVGYYLQDMPTDPITGLAAIPYDQAEKYGYFKIDFLHISLLDNYESKEDIRKLLKMEPNWDLLLDESIYGELSQLGNHYDMVSKIKPRSIPELADCVALIRPGKRLLRNEYIKSSRKQREELRKALYSKVNSGYYFKKSHAHAYAMNIVLQLHYINA